jgi:hypothetical protein
MQETKRRTFLRNSAVAVCGLGVAASPTAGALPADQNDVPEYADWIDDEVLREANPDSADSVVCIDIETIIDLFEFTSELDQDEDLTTDTPPSGLPLVAASLLAGFFWNATLVQWGIAEHVLGAERIFDQQNSTIEANPDTVPSDRHLVYGNLSVYLGSYDTDTIETTVEETDGVTESDTAGIYTGATSFDEAWFFTWSEDAVIVADEIETVERIQAAGNGERSRRHEEDPTFARLLRNGGDRELVELSRNESGQAQYSQTGPEGIDTTPYEDDLFGFIAGNDIDVGGREIDATVGIVHTSEDDIDEADIERLGAGTTERNERRDGAFVVVTMTFSGDDWFYGADPDELRGGSTPTATPTSTPTATPTSTPTSTPEATPTTTATATSEDTATPMSDDDEGSSSDGSGPGFGLLTGATGLGGASYLLRRRLDENDE